MRMRAMERLAAVGTLWGLLLAAAGCGGAPAPGPAKGDAKEKVVAKGDAEKPPEGDPVEPPKKAEPPKPTMPAVTLNEEDAATCVVKVGDTMPELTLPDFEGKEKALKDLYGPKGAIVVFWSHKSPYSTPALEDLSRETGLLNDKGVKIIGVHRGDKAEATLLVVESKINFPQLSDADGAAFAKVATKKFPRIYLLDASGKILWFEMGYDATNTMRVLNEALKFMLGS